MSASYRIIAALERQSVQEQRAKYGAEIVVTLSRQLGWSHIVALIPLGESLKREFCDAVLLARARLAEAKEEKE